jgi:predicted hydrolase (HD superfamily)
MTNRLPLTRDQAILLMTSHITNKGLQKHCLAVGFAMKALAEHFQAYDAPLWELAGILHDSDWEVTKDDHASHTRKTVEWIKQSARPEAKEETEILIRTILSHNCHNNGEPMPTNTREWSLYCCDELTGLIVATALIMPSKKLADVTAESVIKKMNSKNFAAAVDREGIRMCEEKLGISLPEFVSIVLKGMQTGAFELSL